MSDEQHQLEQRLTEAAGPLANAVALLDAERLDGLRQQARFEQGVDGKHLRISVPDAHREGEPAAGSYLRIGGLDAESRARIQAYLLADEASETPIDPAGVFPPETGDDLALLVRGFSADDWPQCGKQRDPEVVGELPGYSPGYDTPSQRAAFSDELHLLGGWREHTDGNRITTTRGDKVEVIGGNYKLLVQCRDEHGNMEAGWDVSAGHVEGATSSMGSRRARTGTGNAGARTETGGEGGETESDVRWVERGNGVWQTVETSRKGDSLTIQHGDSDNVMLGHVQMAKTGDVGATPWHEPEQCESPDDCKANPKVVDRTWAESIHSYSGSEALPIPSMENVTHAMAMDTTTYAETLSDITNAKLMVSQMTVENTFLDKTYCDGMRALVTAGSYADITRCNTMVSTTIGHALDLTVAPLFTSVTLGASDSTTLGATTSFMLGSTTDVTIGASASLSVGASLDIMIGSSVSSSRGATLSLSLVHNEVSAAVDSECAAMHATKALVVMLGAP